MGETVLLLLHVDEKKTTENLVLGFFGKPRFTSSLNLLGRGKEDPSQRLLKGKTEGNEPGRD